MKKKYIEPELQEIKVVVNDICAESQSFGMQDGDVESPWPFKE